MVISVVGGKADTDKATIARNLALFTAEDSSLLSGTGTSAVQFLENLILLPMLNSRR